MKKIGLIAVMILSVGLLFAQPDSQTPMAEKRPKPGTGIIPTTDFVKTKEVSIILSAFKSIKRTDGKWDEWPNKWTFYSSLSTIKPEIRISQVDDNPAKYQLRYVVENKVVNDFIVTYDSEKSKKLRKSWDNEVVNCYAVSGSDGERYIYFENTSLSQLIKDVKVWGKEKESKFYIWDYIDKLAIVAK